MERLSNGLNRIVLSVVLAIMVVETAVVFSAVFSRYVLNNPFSWSEELARLFLVWIVFLGLSCAYATDSMVRITLLGDLAGAWVEKAVMVIADILILIFSVVTLWYSVRLGQMTGSQTLPSLQIPLLWASAAIPVSCVVVVIHAIRFLICGHPRSR
ncbi:TRAP transporter small permease [Martelella sp. FLE1502]